MENIGRLRQGKWKPYEKKGINKMKEEIKVRNCRRYVTIQKMFIIAL